MSSWTVEIVTKPALLRSTLNAGTLLGHDGCTITLARDSETLAAVDCDAGGVRTTRTTVGDALPGCQSLQIDIASVGATSTRAESVPQSAMTSVGNRNSAATRRRQEREEVELAETGIDNTPTPAKKLIRKPSCERLKTQ